MDLTNAVPLKDENGSPLFKIEDGRAGLIGARCSDCDEVVFPKRPQCPKCFTETMEEITLSTRGEVFSSTILYKAPGDPFVGEIPYSVGNVQLPERVLIPCRFSEVGDAPLPVGTAVELGIEVCGEDEDGNVQLMHVFKKV